ncbi:MAG: hypothetical protein H6975_11585 [Gammaproteobacteria bacterium]|nr:hypothetical protein [Gammaproteobacteria bacterium]
MMRKEARAVRTPVASFRKVRTAGRIGDEHRIGLEINAAKLYQLLKCGAVSVTDFRCLDPASKCQVRALCLQACLHRLNEDDMAETMPQRPMKCLS